VKRHPLWKLAALLMSASVGGQAVAGLLLFAGTLTLSFHEGSHAHAVSLVSERGHLHLVLSHDEARGSEGSHDAATRDARLASFSESDHVLHLESDALLEASARRADPTPTTAPVPAVPLASSPAASFVPRRPPKPDAPGPGLLRTVVLRL
jgi:hypothetical protein